MSTLGKILTVLVALVAIAVAVLVARDFVMTRNWHDAYNTQVDITKVLAAQRDNAIAERDKQKADRDTERAALEGQIATQRDAIAQRDGALVLLRKEKENQEARLAEIIEKYASLDKSFQFLVSERQKWLDERDKAIATADLFTKMYSELEVRFRTDQNNLANLKSDLTGARDEIADLQGKIQLVKQNYPQVRITEKGPYPPVASMNGLITLVDNAAKVAEINLGSDSGVVPGTVFVVYGDPGTKFLAELTIKKVGPNTAAGELSVIRGTVKVNDHVQNKPGQ